MKDVVLLFYLGHPYWLYVSHLDYGIVTYAQTSKNFFSNNIETIQHNAALTVTGVNKGNKGKYREKSYQELKLKYLQQWRWTRRLGLLYKGLSTKILFRQWDNPRNTKYM